MTLIDPGTTYPETAWIAHSFPLWLAVALALGASLVLRGPLRRAIQALLYDQAVRARRRTGRGDLPIDPALHFASEVVAPQQLIAIALVVVVAGLLTLSLLTPVLLALLLAMPIAGLVLWAVVWGMEQRYTSALDRSLPPAVGRLVMQMQAGDSFALALETVAAELCPGPLRDEWLFIVQAINRPLSTTLLATDAECVFALGAQTPSLRHSSFLSHLEVALGQPQDAQVKRLRAAHAGLLEAEQRRSSAATELAQMRYSGYVIGLAATGLALYLAATQWDRFVTAYTGVLGPFAAVLVGAALAAPFVAGSLLARVEDVDY
nr:MAG: hypothetical protein DIU80_05625 [Chloroflexota bacterium]